MIASDKILEYGSVTNGLLVTVTVSGLFAVTTLLYSTSGTTEPEVDTRRRIWYDTANNVIKTYAPSLSDSTQVSLPIAIVDCTEVNKFTIKQVFNGFGYIGSTVFALPGVKGLAPNGRNADGSLRNEEWSSDRVITRTFTNTVTNGVIAFNPNEPVAGYIFGIISAASFYYNSQENRIYNVSSNTVAEWRFTLIAPNVTMNAGVISNFNPKPPFRAIDYNDKQEIVRWGVPDYTSEIVVNATSYTAPKDGIVLVNCVHKDNNSNNVSVNGIQIYTFSMSGSYANGTMTPFPLTVLAGDVITSNRSILKFYPFRGV